MRVTVFQYSTIWMDHEANLARIDAVCQKISGTSDLLLLPEMFNTGYTMQPSAIPPGCGQITINKLMDLAYQHDLTIAGSIPIKKEDGYYNSFIAINKDGIIYQYDKIHLFTPAGEKEVYNDGLEIKMWNFNGWTIQGLVCYDLRFPYVSFHNATPEIIIYSANWPTARIHHWKQLLIARAIENQAYVIGINRTGDDLNGYHYPGASCIIDFAGETVLMLDDQPSFQTVTLDKDALTGYRKKLPFLDDRKSNF
ncbi:MAG: nitrilase-related carbon-nitrogen hydrolase [Saprospiraceae bacterium]